MSKEISRINMVLKLVNQRKAGKEYCDVIDNLAQANKLENLEIL
jgi:hypothetical protein